MWENHHCPAALQTDSYIQAQPPQESCPHLEAQHLLGRETGGNPRQDGAGLLPPGVMKQLTVDHSGGENISNTVGRCSAPLCAGTDIITLFGYHIV